MADVYIYPSLRKHNVNVETYFQPGPTKSPFSCNPKLDILHKTSWENLRRPNNCNRISRDKQCHAPPHPLFLRVQEMKTMLHAVRQRSKGTLNSPIPLIPGSAHTLIFLSVITKDPFLQKHWTNSSKWIFLYLYILWHLPAKFAGDRLYCFLYKSNIMIVCLT